MLSYFVARGESVVKHSKYASPEGRLRVLSYTLDLSFPLNQRLFRGVLVSWSL